MPNNNRGYEHSQRAASAAHQKRMVEGAANRLKWAAQDAAREELTARIMREWQASKVAG